VREVRRDARVVRGRLPGRDATGGGRGGDGAGVPAQVDLDAVDGGRRGVSGCRTSADLGVRAGGVQPVDVAIAALRSEADVRHERAVGIALTEVRPLAGADALEVRLRLALLRASLEADEVRNGDGGENADDGDHDHQLDEREAALDLLHVR